MKAFSFLFFFLATVLLCLCKLMVMLGGVAVAILLHNPHENVGFDPRIYVAEKEGCLL